MSPPDADLPDEGEPLRHNTANAVTGGVDRVRGANGQRLVRKRLHGPGTRVGSGLWATSDDPTHWNYWRREIEAYADPELSAALAGTRLRLLTLVEQSPRTTCHLDAWPSNVVVPPAGDVVLLDWAFAGNGAIGEDVGNWVPDSCLDLFWPAERIDELDHVALQAYLDGLTSAAWSGTRMRCFWRCARPA